MPTLHLQHINGALTERRAVGLSIYNATGINGWERIRLPGHTLLMRSDAVAHPDGAMRAHVNWEGRRFDYLPCSRDGVATEGITFMPAGTEATAEVNLPFDATLVRFDQNVVADALGDIPFNFSNQEFTGVDSPSAVHLATSLHNLAHADLLAKYPTLSESMALALVVETLRGLAPDTAARIEQVKAALSRERKRRVLDFIEANLDRVMSLSEMASVANLSSYHFARSFKADLGVSPVRYMVHRRVERGKRLLAAGEAIAVVAHECGFASQSHFTTIFKAMTGLTPGEYRERCGFGR